MGRTRTTRHLLAAVACACLLGPPAASAQQPRPQPPRAPDLESLEHQIGEMRLLMQQMQEQHRRETDMLKAQIKDLHEVVDGLRSAHPPAPAAQTVPRFPTTDESVTAAPGPAAASGTAEAAPRFPTTDESVTTAPAPSGAPAQAAPPWAGGPITLAGAGKSYVNLSFNGQFSAATSTTDHLDRLEVGDHDPQQRGFNARNIELALDGAVDPYFEGFANVVFKLDNDNQTSVEVEEAYMQTTTLAWNLQARGGQFFAPLGRLNPQHPHVWDFVDTPLVNGRLLGPDGLRGVGAQLAWLMPLPWYAQLSLAVQNGSGSTGYSFRNRGEDDTFYSRSTLDRSLTGLDDLVFVPRMEGSFDLTPTQTLLLGTSGAFGPNDTGSATRTRIYGVDAFYKWKSARSSGGFPFVKWQSEAMLRRFEAGHGLDGAFPVAETFDDWGAYSQVVWGFSKGWCAGMRGDYLHMEDSDFTDDPVRRSRWRLSPDLTWYPTEFSKFRLQYNHDFLLANHFVGDGNADSVFLQFEFNLGAHGAHKF